jgi:hypothetical protein
MEKKSSEMQTELDKAQTQLRESWGKLRDARKENSESRKQHRKELSDARESISRMEKELAEFRDKAPKIVDMDDVNATLISSPPGPNGNNKCSLEAVLLDNQADNNRVLKKIKKEKDDTARQL